MFKQSTYNRSSVDANNKVEPGLDSKLKVGVPQDLEAKRAPFLSSLLLDISVQARDETIQRIEHGAFGSSICRS